MLIIRKVSDTYLYFGMIAHSVYLANFFYQNKFLIRAYLTMPTLRKKTPRLCEKKKVFQTKIVFYNYCKKKNLNKEFRILL